jgi:hypothetical protein
MLEIAVCGLCGADCSFCGLNLYAGEELCVRCYKGAIEGGVPKYSELLSNLRRSVEAEAERGFTASEWAWFVDEFNGRMDNYAEELASNLIRDLEEMED